MILNGDYFDDLKLTDEDIESSDDINHNTDDYANPEEYYNEMSSKYSHYIVLGITDEHILTDSDLWTNKIPCMLKKLFYLFDAYGIEYSKPVVSEEDYHISYLIKTKLEECKIFDFHGYKLFTTYDTLEGSNNLSVLLFFNLPKTPSYTAACKFVGNIMKTLWRNKDTNTFVDSMYVYNIISVMGFALFNPYTHYDKVNNIDKTSIVEPYWKLVTIVSLFFPKKKYNNIKKELTEDKQLLLKLYNCFPD